MVHPNTTFMKRCNVCPLNVCEPNMGIVSYAEQQFPPFLQCFSYRRLTNTGASCTSRVLFGAPITVDSSVYSLQFAWSLPYCGLTELTETQIETRCRKPTYSAVQWSWEPMQIVWNHIFQQWISFCQKKQMNNRKMQTTKLKYELKKKRKGKTVG